MEIFDICDEMGNPTGETVERSTAHREGICHRASHIWIIRRVQGRVQVLLQKRSANKDSFPGQYDTSSAGHIQAGDEPLESAIRELKEELGIDAGKEDFEFIGTFRVNFEKEFHGRLFKDNEVAFVYIYNKEVDEDKLTLQAEEVESVKWFDLEEVYEGKKRHDETFCVPLQSLEMLKNSLGI